MTEPQAWSNLAEAAAWLSARTGKAWTPRQLLDAALRASIMPLEDGKFVARNPVTLVSAPPPFGLRFRRRWVPMLEWPDTDTAPTVIARPDGVPKVTPVRLKYTQVFDLMSAGWCAIGMACPDFPNQGDGNVTPTYLAPQAPYDVKAEDCGLNSADLIELAGYVERMHAIEAVEVGQQAGDPSGSSQTNATETKEQRQERRFVRFTELGGKLRKAGKSWHVHGTRAALQRLVDEEIAAGRPLRQRADVKRDLEAFAGSRTPAANGEHSES